MPLYEYQCRACEHRFERIQKFSDPLVTECPSCGGVVDKLLSSPAIQFKGSGWYVNDYAKAGKGGTTAKSTSSGESSSDNKSEKSEKSEKAESSASTSEAAPAAKPATTSSDPK